MPAYRYINEALNEERIEVGTDADDASNKFHAWLAGEQKSSHGWRSFGVVVEEREAKNPRIERAVTGPSETR